MTARGLYAPPTRRRIISQLAQVTACASRKSGRQQPLRQALDRQLTSCDQQLALKRDSLGPLDTFWGNVRQKYDLIVIGSRRSTESGRSWQSHRTYEIIKAVEPSVLVAIGTHEGLSRILLCSGGKHFIDDAVRLTGTFAAALHAKVTLFHVMAEPPAIYAHLTELEEDMTAFASFGSELGPIWSRKRKRSKNSESSSMCESCTASFDQLLD